MPGVSLDQRDPGVPYVLSSTFLRAVSIDVCHSYYNRSARLVCSDLSVRPTHATLDRLARFGFVWRPRSDGGDIFVSTVFTGALGELMAWLKANPDATTRRFRQHLFGTPLMFTIGIDRPEFLNVTDIVGGFGAGRRTLCLSNRHSVDRGPGHRGRIPEATIVPDRHHSIALHDADELGDPPQDAAAVVRRKLEHERRGAGPAWWQGAEAAEFLEEAKRQAVGSRSRRLPFAILELHTVEPTDAPGPGAGSLYPVTMTPTKSPSPGDVTAGHLTPVRYRLAFEAKATRWRYVIGTRGDAVDAGSLNVRDPAPAEAAVRFAADDETLPPFLPGARATRAFLSDSVIAFRQRPTKGFYLEGKASRRSAARLIDPLPVPGPDTLSRRCPAGEGDVSEIYVFV